MRHTNYFIDIEHPLGTVGLLLLLAVARLAGPALTTQPGIGARSGGFLARRALDVISAIGWGFDQLPNRPNAAPRGHRAGATNRATGTA